MDIIGFEGKYRVSTIGRIRSLPRMTTGRNGTPRRVPDRIMKTGSEEDGYPKVRLALGNKTSRLLLVHRLVAVAFVPNPEGKPEVNHIDGIKTNNLVTNLEWVTVQEQIQHAHRTGLNKGPWGESSRTAKLTLEKVIEIRKRQENGEVDAALGREFGVGGGAIRKIRRRKSWKYI